MKYTFLIICVIILPVLSLKKVTHKLCVNCKFFINSDNGDNKYSKCSFFPSDVSHVNFLVTGVENNKYNYCSVARSFESMCGKEGKAYKKKRVLNDTIGTHHKP